MVVIVKIPGVPVVIKACPAAPGCQAQARVDLMGPLARQHATCTAMPVLQFPISLYVCRSNAPHKPGVAYWCRSKNGANTLIRG